MSDSDYETSSAVDRITNRGLTEEPAPIIQAYVAEVIELQLRLTHLQTRVEAVDVGTTGFCAGSAIAEISDDFGQLLTRTTRALRAVHDADTLAAYGRGEDSLHGDALTQLETIKEEGAIYDELERLETQRDTTVSMLDNKVTTINTRKSLALSVAAILVSVLTLVGSFLTG